MPTQRAGLLLSFVVAVPSLCVGLPAQQWQPTTMEARKLHCAAFDAARGRTVVFGGFVGGTNYRRDTWTYAGSAWVPEGTAVSPAQRGHGAMAYDSSLGRVVLFGGTWPNGLLGDTWEYDGANWIPAGNTVAPPARRDHALAFDAVRNTVVLFGGITHSTQAAPVNVLDDTWEYAGGNWAQRAPAIVPAARFGHALAFDTVRGRTVLFGGSTTGGLLADTWEFDGSNWLQRATTAAPPARIGHQLAWNGGRARIMLFGGTTVADTWEYDGANWTVLATATLPPARTDHVLVHDALRNRTVVFGGADASGALLVDTWEFDGIDWAPAANVAATPQGRSYPALAYDSGRARTVLFGGFGSNLLGDTWDYGASGWLLRSPLVAPSARVYAAMAFDVARQRTVLFGGSDWAQAFAETWEFDGSNWQLATPSPAPSARNNPGLAYDLARRRIVLFGGSSLSGRLGDTWEYDGTWRQVATAHAPSPRYLHAMVYDAARGATMLFGGSVTNSSQSGETWAFDGADWTLRTSAGPAPRMDHAMAFDAVRGRTVLFGGVSNLVIGRFGDTWEYDGTTWQQLAPSQQPTGRDTARLVYDLARTRAVMFGNPEQVADTWELLPPATASWTRYGIGCGGLNSTPTLDALPGSVPSLGGTCTLRLAAAPGPAFLLFGFDLVRWNGVPLPVDFDPSRPACNLWIAPLPGSGLLLLPTAGTAQYAFVIPANPGLAGLVLGTQALALDGSVAAGFALTNGGVLRVH